MSWDVSCNTVDGRNPAPVEVGSLSHYSQGSMHPWWFFTGFLPSTVVPENWWSLYSKAAAIEVVHFVKRVKVLVHFFAETFWIFMEGNFFSNAVGNPPRNRGFSTQVAPILGELRI